MKWRPRYQLEQCHPKGELRTRTCFAWRPIITQNGTIVWLERYTRLEVYTDTWCKPWPNRRYYNVWSWKLDEAHAR